MLHKYYYTKPPGYDGIDLVVIILCDGIFVIKHTSTFTSSSNTTNFLNPKLVGTIIRPCE